MPARTRPGPATLLLLSLAVVAVTCPEAFALITGGKGNEPLRDPGWPRGAAAIFNVPSRIAWWEGPPLGGGEWHAECRGDARALSAVLVNFAKLDVKAKRVVLYDGVGNSFWLNLNNDPAKRDEARMDWSFTVWQTANWQRLRQLPPDLNPAGRGQPGDDPPAQLEVYTGGNVKWADVAVPNGLTIVDQRLEAHGFRAADGRVLEGTVTDLTTQKPLAATIRLERLEPQRTGGYRHVAVMQTTAGADGHWVLKKAPAGWHSVVATAEGYVPRVLGSIKADDQPRWQSFSGGLARPAVVTGRVTDDAGQPLAGAEVRLGDVTAGDGEGYATPEEFRLKTDADGRFRADQVPAGRATVWVHKPGYVRPGLGQPITTPQEDLPLTMIRAGRIVVTVDFAGKERPKAYIVSLAPEGGEVVGSYGGSGHINGQNQMVFDIVPPGKYVVRGAPNPTTEEQRTEPLTVDVQGGKTAEVTLRAR